MLAELDQIAQRLHADMSLDGTTDGMAYMTVAGMQGKRPIDVVCEEGCREAYRVPVNVLSAANAFG